MEILRAVWHFIVIQFVRLATLTHLYQIKSYIYRAIFERDLRNVKLTTWSSLEDIALFIHPEAWRADGWKTLYDAVSYPGKAQLVFEGKLTPTADFDCDEFAIWLAASLELCKAADSIKGLQEIVMMSINWANEGFAIEGHNVCVFKMANDGFYVMDYGMPVGPFNSPTEAACDVVRRYSKGKGKPLVSSCHNSHLVPVSSSPL